MQFDITKTPLTVEEIQREKARLADDIAACEASKDRIKGMTFPTNLFMILINAIAFSYLGSDVFLPTLVITAFIFGFTLISQADITLKFTPFAIIYTFMVALFFPYFFIEIGNSSERVNFSPLTIQSYIAPTLTLFVSFFYHLHIYFNLPKIEQIDNRQTALASLNDARIEDCIKIQDWLHDSVILTYRDLVLEQGRQFLSAEVLAMEEYYTQKHNRAALSDAYEEVYNKKLLL